MYLSALVLGGVWAAQELNWGGWWNWDVLETSAALLGVLILMAAHTQANGALAPRMVKVTLTLFTGVAIFILNKVGLGFSIHSFAASPALRRTFVFCVISGAATLCLAVDRVRHVLTVFVGLLWLYSALAQAAGLKWYCVGLLQWLSLRRTTPRLIKAHQSVFSAAVGFWLWNAASAWYQTVYAVTLTWVDLTADFCCLRRSGGAPSLFQTTWVQKPNNYFDG